MISGWPGQQFPSLRTETIHKEQPSGYPLTPPQGYVARRVRTSSEANYKQEDSIYSHIDKKLYSHNVDGWWVLEWRIQKFPKCNPSHVSTTPVVCYERAGFIVVEKSK